MRKSFADRLAALEDQRFRADVEAVVEYEIDQALDRLRDALTREEYARVLVILAGEGYRAATKRQA